jgi:cytochrome P450
MGAILTVFPWLFSVGPYLGLPITNRITTVTRRMRSYATSLMEKYKLLAEADPLRVKKTLFTKVFQAEEADALNFEEVMANAQSYIVAGSNTTAHSLTYLIWAICRDAGVRDNLVKELQTLPEDFQEPDLRGLSYLGHVINEGLRLYAAVPSGLPRVVPPGGADILGYGLDEGTVVCAQAYSMHRDPVMFPKPNEFDPARWENATKEMKDAVMPFGKGARGEKY